MHTAVSPLQTVCEITCAMTLGPDSQYQTNHCSEPGTREDEEILMKGHFKSGGGGGEKSKRRTQASFKSEYVL